MEEPPETFEETILSYLKGQELYGEGGFEVHVEAPRDSSPEENVKTLLEDLLFKVNRRIACRDRYENLKAWHNQYPLFDLEDFVVGFCMDEDMMKKICFRESLLISELDTVSETSEPKPVGGLCLNIQLVEARVPDERMKPTDADLENAIIQTLKRAKNAVVGKPKGAEVHTKIEDELQRKFNEYENYLKDQMKQTVKKFVVHLSSQFEVGYNAGSRITSWIDRNLHTLEEKRTEYIYEDENTYHEKSLYMALQNRKYYLRHTSNKENLEERKYYSLAKANNLIGEGADFLLMRYLAIIRYSGSFEMSTTYINGDLCRNIYECTGPKQGIINDKRLEICKIYRYIIEESGIEHHCVTVLTVYGQIVSQEWEGCSYILNLNPLQFISEATPSPYQRLVLEKTWIDDMELLSEYLDCKTEAELKMKTYMSDHPEVKDILADYVNNILLLKPENILSFTMDYFQSLYPIKMGKMGYFEPHDKDDNFFYNYQPD